MSGDDGDLEEKLIRLDGGNVKGVTPNTPPHFLDLVKNGLAEREIRAIIVLALDRHGMVTFHSSSLDMAKNLALSSLAVDHSKRAWLESLYEVSGETDNDDGEPPEAA